MTVVEPETVTPDWSAAGILACDRCLALSYLMTVLARVPELRGEERADPKLDEDGNPIPPPPIFDPQVASAVGLAPTPGALILATVGVSAERAAAMAFETRGWSADAVRAACLASGLAAWCGCTEEYPPALRRLADPPSVLYVRGDSAVLARCDTHAVAMVGTRHPTAVGREAARRIGAGASRTGLVVVSGMALGIDAASHEGALSVGGATVAVLASGADLATPGSHQRLYGRILERGAVVSEMPPGVRPYVWGFSARNRIIAALAQEVVVVEAPLRSGALITVDFAGQLGLQTYAVPGSLANENAEGTNKMLMDGSMPLIDGTGLKREEGLTGEAPLSPRDERLAGVHAALERRPLTIDEVARKVTSLGPGEVELALLDLELAGWITRRPDGRYRVMDRWGR